MFFRSVLKFFVIWYFVFIRPSTDGSDRFGIFRFGFGSLEFTNGTRLGTRPTGESIRKIIKSKLRQLGIDEKAVSVHALRHLFASAYNEATQNDLA